MGCWYMGKPDAMNYKQRDLPDFNKQKFDQKESSLGEGRCETGFFLSCSHNWPHSNRENKKTSRGRNEAGGKIIQEFLHFNFRIFACP